MKSHAKLALICGFCCLLFLCLPMTGQARTWVVERDGTGDFTAIQPAVDAAAPGDSVFIGPGEYTEFQTIQLPGSYLMIDVYVYVQTSNLAFIGASSESVVIGPEVQDFQLEGPKAVFIDGAIAKTTWRNACIRNCFLGIHGSDGQLDVTLCKFQECDIGIGFHDEGLTVNCCTFDNCVSDGIFLYGAQVATIRNSQFRDCEWGVSIQSSNNAHISDCTFSGNDIGVQYSSGTGSVVDCTFADQSLVGLSFRNYSNVTATNNTVSNSRINMVAENYCILQTSGNVFNGGWYATLRITFCPISMHGNHILNGGGYSVLVGEHADGEPAIIDLTNNYWGTTDSSQIDEWILDGHDQPNMINAFVEYEPFANAPIGTEQQSWGRVKALYR
jgi:parallel beta-helix repeat protein